MGGAAEVFYQVGGRSLKFAGLLHDSEIILHPVKANPVEVIVASTPQGKGVFGVIDGFSPKGVETAEDKAHRKEFLRKIGYKL